MLNPNFRDMLVALNDAGANYLVVGAYAMAAQASGQRRALALVQFPASSDVARFV